MFSLNFHVTSRKMDTLAYRFEVHIMVECRTMLCAIDFLVQYCNGFITEELLLNITDENRIGVCVRIEKDCRLLEKVASP